MLERMVRLAISLGVAVFLGVSVALVSGCQQGPRIMPAPTGPIPTRADVAASQSKRCAALSTLGLKGHAQLNWKDEAGTHFDDGDFDLLMQPPWELCLRVSKLGERILWIGSNQEIWWIVYPTEKPSRAVVHSVTGAAAADSGGVESGSLEALVAPSRLMEALGVATISPEEIRRIEWDGAMGAWCCTLGNRRVYMRGEGLLPVGCDWTDESGEVVATCRLDAFGWPEGQRASGQTTGEIQPLVATRIALEVWNGRRRKSHGDPDASMALAAQQPQYATDRVKPQLFRWEDVRAALNPEVIEEVKP